MRKKGFTQNEQVMMGLLAILAFATFQNGMQFKKHQEDCSAKSALVIKILSSLAIMVLGELILKGVSLVHLGIAP